MPRILTTKNVVERIGKHRSTIYRWVRQGTFPAPVVVGDRNGFYESEVEEWEATRPRVNYAPIDAGAEATPAALIPERERRPGTDRSGANFSMQIPNPLERSSSNVLSTSSPRTIQASRRPG